VHEPVECRARVQPNDRPVASSSVGVDPGRDHHGLELPAVGLGRDHDGHPSVTDAQAQVIADSAGEIAVVVIELDHVLAAPGHALSSLD
jgi:hypothetical protein